jgi:hypothetical protein
MLMEDPRAVLALVGWLIITVGTVVINYLGRRAGWSSSDTALNCIHSALIGIAFLVTASVC